MFVITVSVQRQNGSDTSNDSRNINVKEESEEKIAGAFAEAEEYLADRKTKYVKKVK